MTLRLVPLECGRLSTDTAGLMQGASGTASMPIPSWVVVHPSGRSLVFDTGLHKELQVGVDRIGSMADIFEVDFSEGEEVSERLRRVDLDPDELDFIVFSHLHFDHCGGTALLPNARIVVQASEWAAGHRPNLIEHDVYNPGDFDVGHDVLQVEGEHDVFGDGSVTCIPTPGHTIGHQSLRVNLDSGPMLLTGDCVYWRDAIENMLLPPFGYDLDAQLASMEAIKALRDDEGCRLLYGHDNEQWARLPKDAAGLT